MPNLSISGSIAVACLIKNPKNLTHFSSEVGLLISLEQFHIVCYKISFKEIVSNI